MDLGERRRTLMKEFKPHDYSKDYFTFEVLESGTFSHTINQIEYSLDYGTTWVTLPINTQTPTIQSGTKIIWKGNLRASNYDGPGTFKSTCRFNVSGNILSILYDTNFRRYYSLPNISYSLTRIFSSNTNVVSCKNLILPSRTAGQCYYQMFFGCTSLTDAPELPATTLADDCYTMMFYKCTSLTTAPVLPATTLAKNCYYQMFQNCTSLTTAPSILPATTLANSCYYSMFNGCTSLTTAPVLPATTLVTYCYDHMFDGCTNLNYIKAMFTTKPSSTYTGYWVRNVKSTGTYVKNSRASYSTRGNDAIPTGWTVQTASV